MPLDPSISLPSAALLQSIANPPNPLDIQAKQLALQNARLQSQAYQQQIASGALEQQQRQLALQQQQATIDAYRNSGGDLNATIAALKAKGLYNQAIALQKNQNELQDETDKQIKARDEHQAQLRTVMANLATSVLTGKDDTARSILYDNARRSAVQLQPELDKRLPPMYTSALEPQLQAIAGISQTPKEAAETGAAQALTKQRTQETAQKQRQDALNQLSAAGDQAAYDQTIDQLSKAGTPDDILAEFRGQKLTPEYQAQLKNRALTEEQRQTQAGQAEARAQTKAHQQFLEKMEQTRTGLALKEFQQKFGNPFEGATDADMLRYESILRGDSPMPSPRSAAGIKTANAVMALAAQRGDNYTDARYKTKQNFKTGKDSDNLVRLTTGLEHAERAQTNSGKLGFSPSLLTGQTLSPEASQYIQDVEHLGGELGNLVKGGQVTIDEEHRLTKNLRSSRQDVRDAALQETMNLLSGKVEGIQQKYRAGTGQDIPVEQFYDKPTQARMRHFGIGGQPGTTAPAANVQASPQLQNLRSKYNY